jgi:predicted TIM-barrel fold metal-dependent hydrolase
MTAPTGVDVHQHLWPEPLVDRLRARTRPPFLRGWTLHTHGEPPFEVDPADHDPAGRVLLDHAADVALACVSLSAPLGIEGLPRPEAGALLAAWHAGAAALPEHFAAWASVPAVDPDLAALADLLADDRFVGVQLPATDLLSPAAWERAAPVLRVAELAGRPVFVHPGPEPQRPTTGTVPGWWAPVVGYVAQLHGAWWGWHAYGGRAAFPALRLLFAAGAGLAPVHHERHAARGGRPATIDRDVFVDTSSYGPQGLDALVRVLGIDVLALGSDRPYAEPLRELLGDAATRAIRTTNPLRLLGGDRPRVLPPMDDTREQAPR